MPAPVDPYNFSNGSTADAEQVDARFAALYAALNGALDDSNIAVGGIGADKLKPEAWTTYVPTLVGIALGSPAGSNIGRFIQQGKVVHARGTLTIGTGGSLAATATVSLPVLPVAAEWQVGHALAIDLPAGTFYTGAAYVSGEQKFELRWNGITAPGVPFTFGTPDRIMWQITYQAA